MWVDNLPGNLELLTLLSVSSPNVSNSAASPPLMLDPVLVPDDVPRDQRAAYRKEYNQARRARAEAAQSSSSRGAKKQSIGREDVLIALEGLDDIDNFFVLGFTGLLTSPSISEYARIVYIRGIERDNLFTSITMDEFGPVFAVAFKDLVDPCDKKGKLRTNIGSSGSLARSLGCGRVKSERLLETYNDVAHILITSAQKVSVRLHCSLKRAA